MPAGGNLGTIASLSLRDAGNEPTTFKIFGPVITAANFTAKEALWATLWAAAMALVLGVKTQTNYGTQINYDWSQPVNGAARELALRTRYKDATTGARFTAKLGTLDPAIPDYVVNEDARDVVLLATPAEVAAYITAFNAFVVNPFTGNACVVTGLKVTRGAK